MADAVKIRVEVRDPAKNKGTGTKFARKLRKEGRIPAIIYGHKATPTPISLARDSVWEMIKKKTHLAELEMDGGANETVLVRDIQWDHLGKEIIHLDFARVSASDSVETEVPIELRGTAPGLAEGGILEQLIHDIVVACRADAIPNDIKVDIGALAERAVAMARVTPEDRFVGLADGPTRFVLTLPHSPLSAELLPVAAG